MTDKGQQLNNWKCLGRELNVQSRVYCTAQLVNTVYVYLYQASCWKQEENQEFFAPLAQIQDLSSYQPTGSACDYHVTSEHCSSYLIKNSICTLTED